VAALLGFAGAAFPESAVAEENDPLGPLRDCPSIADPLERVACFDKGFAEADRKLGTDRVEKAVRTREEFGLTGSQLEEKRQEREAKEREPVESKGVVAQATPAATPTPEAADGDLDRISDKISEVFTDGAQHKVFLLENGQIWRETTGSTYRGILRSGFEVEIRKSMMGGYRLTIDGRTGFFVVRRIR
jgi:hypothetical protein